MCRQEADFMMRTLSPGSLTRGACRAGALLLVLLALQTGEAAAQCTGDCNSDGAVAINELIVGVNIAAGSVPVSQCPSFDVNRDGSVAINELIAAVGNALNGCPMGGTPTSTPTGPVLTATPTATRTPTTGGGTPTLTPTSPAGCGNSVVDTQLGETCDDGNRNEEPGDSCPADCQIRPCIPSGDTLVADVIFDTAPPDLLIAGLTVFVRYPDGTVDVPGSNNDPAVQTAVVSDFFSITPNDQNYALTALLIDPFNLGVNAGGAISVTLDVCEGASPPPASAFDCRVVDAADEMGATVTDQVTCRVELR
jgi:hypothetical protein